MQVLIWDLTGLDPTCTAGAGDDVTNGCGIHVHSGMTCADASLVGGHYYSSALSSDPWANVVYVADSTSASVGHTVVTTGLTLDAIVGHAFVVHHSDGSRIA